METTNARKGTELRVDADEVGEFLKFGPRDSLRGQVWLDLMVWDPETEQYAFRHMISGMWPEIFAGSKVEA